MRDGGTRFLLSGVLLVVLLAPQLGRACAVCFSSNDENRLAFAVTTVFLTALPLVMIGCFVLWLRQRVFRLRGTLRGPAS